MMSNGQNGSSDLLIAEIRDRLTESVDSSRNGNKEDEDDLNRCCDPSLVEVTNWPKVRPCMNCDFLESSQKTFDLVPMELLENLLIDDLISCFFGFNGRLIVSNPLPSPYASRSFTISDQVDGKHRDFCYKALKLASNYSLVTRFIQDNKQLACGRVNQALSYEMEKIVLDYKNFVVCLEDDLRKRNLTLHLLYFKIQPASHTMKSLARIIRSINSYKATGGATLSLLNYAEVSLVSDDDNRTMLELITTNASIPFLESVQKWIFRGLIFDPYDEFMISENPRLQTSKDQNSDEYWTKRYQLRNQFVPKFLENIGNKILDCGKYLNVIQECTSVNSCVFENEEEILKYNSSGSNYIAIIDKAYRYASAHLLDILINQYKVIDRIRSAKRYMLLQQGDFVIQVLETCEEDLLKPLNEFVPSRLSALIEMAIRIPSTSDDIYRDDIILCQKPHDLSRKILGVLSTQNEDVSSEVDIIGFDVFYLDVECVWPVSLILSHDIRLLYQMLFRHLLYCKYIERLLSRVWLWDKSMNLRSLRQSRGYIKAFSLRNSMMIFVQNIEYYMMNEVIEPYWVEFMEKIPKISNVDDLMKMHRDFLEKCLKDCMLTMPLLLDTFRELLDVCRKFSEFVLSMEKSNFYENRTFSQCIDQFGNDFEKYFLGLLGAIQELSVTDSEKLMNLCERQNFNFIFSEKLEQIAAQRSELKEQLKKKMEEESDSGECSSKARKVRFHIPEEQNK